MSLKHWVLVILNTALAIGFVFLIRKANLLSYFKDGRVWLTWFSVAIITLMDELSSVFYAPAEAYRFIGPSAIVYIAFTALFIHYMTTRLVEIAQILEYHGIYGGGVYSFSYLVLGPTVGFIAVASIMVAYILTACLSAVSAVENVSSFLNVSHWGKMAISLLIIWGIAGLNILGIKENARFTFGIFVIAALIFLNLMASGIVELDSNSIERLKHSADQVRDRLDTDSVVRSYGIFIASVASCILAYSGVESVLQTASLVRSWREIGKAYIFLAVSVGLVTPVIAALALSAPIDFAQHEGDLIIHYATLINGTAFGITVGALASLTLILAVNTAFVASGELIERVGERYALHGLIKTNRRQSLYRIHIMNALAFSGIILLTSGSQMVLADMYALGLIASFCINMTSLLIYRYFMGTKEVQSFYTSRLVTFCIWAIFISCFFFLAWIKLHGTLLWGTVTGVVLISGLLMARTRSPEIKERAEGDSQMDMVIYLAESPEQNIHIYFQRPREEALTHVRKNEAYIVFYNTRESAPPKLSENYFRFPMMKRSLYQHMIQILSIIEYEFHDYEVNIHFGWPLSSWLDRMSIGVMIFNIIALPKKFPHFKFTLDYPGRPRPK